MEEWQQEMRWRYIEVMLIVAYAKCMAEVIPGLVKQRCFGCNLLDIQTGELYDHPSQQHHNLCTMDLVQKIDACFDDAMEEIDDTEDLYLNWFDELAKMDPPVHYTEFVKYCCRDWRLAEWMTDMWRYKVTEAIRQNI